VALNDRGKDFGATSPSGSPAPRGGEKAAFQSSPGRGARKGKGKEGGREAKGEEE
jgi:hypothetical protein